jgi:ABC-type Zn uptake system ZnuABC Zn-binding protein ZnuA
MTTRGALLLIGLGLAAWPAAAPAGRFAQGAAPEPINVCATIPDLGALAREIGGDRVSVSVFCKGQEDAHFVEAKPSFIRSLSRADVFIQSGLELEIGWAPVLLQSARNARILPGTTGFIDASTAISPLEIPSGPIDRSMGDIHPLGNPHYLLDPVNGLRVAALIRDKLVALRPEEKAAFDERYAAFARRVVASMAGPALASKYDPSELARQLARGTLEAFLRERNETDSLGGWLGAMRPFRRAPVVSDHNIWAYFAARFGLDVLGFLEPKPGLPPTTRHLGGLIETMKARGVKVIMTVPYFDLRHAQFVAKNTGAVIVSLAHQTGARPGTDDYLALIDYDIRRLAEAMGPQRTGND